MRYPAFWARRGLLARLLWPLSRLYCAIARLRRAQAMAGARSSQGVGVPVVVVGNISVGGTGKTPLIGALVEALRARGFHPGIVSRGYGGRVGPQPRPVLPDSRAEQVGDEPRLLAQSTGVPVWVHPDRVAAVRALLAAYPACDLILSDDGLQHYPLARDVELAVVDGLRRLGNGWCLPAGPLREGPERLKSVDAVVCNGGRPAPGEYFMQLQPFQARRLCDGVVRPLSDFAGRSLHALAGIGHPERFFQSLRDAGLTLQTHAFPDHHAYTRADLALPGDGPLLMTVKDAVKCAGFDDDRLWQVEARVELDPRLVPWLIDRLSAVPSFVPPVDLPAAGER
ncbi:MAG: tetraacyldisaccharide 4'-kinase [Pseudomonadota bacterium]